ncbi:MAG: nucleotidyltransferase domain-containing protein [Phycisphaeraceae bacterium]|nr:MAG: nucleotidyltransferase domain-containing protein [Phycisphaeraceae bacterium]
MNPQNVEKALPEIIERLRKEFEPVAIYLHGSAARGTAGPESDVDLLVVVEHSSVDFFERSTAARHALRGLGAPIDVQVYTRAEFEERASLPVSFERVVAAKGRKVYAA